MKDNFLSSSLNWLVFTFFCFFSLASSAQSDNCAGAIQICPQQTYNYTNAGATTEIGPNQADGNATSGFACFDVDNSVWLTFTTNTLGGNVELNISKLNCSSFPGFDQELQAVIIDALIPCDASTYSIVSNCISNSSSNFSLTALNLLPTHQYWVMVDGDFNGAGITNAAECGFDVDVFGPGIVGSAGLDQNIEEGESAQLTGAGGTTYTWNPGASLSNPNISNPVASPTQTTNYFVSVTANGCTTVDDVLIQVLPVISIPNTFTPNGDDFNDTWVIGRINEYQKSELRVYSRWGQEVFHQIGAGSNTSWNGKVNGKPLPMGTYYYVLDLDITNEELPIYKGSVTIVY